MQILLVDKIVTENLNMKAKTVQFCMKLLLELDGLGCQGP